MKKTDKILEWRMISRTLSHQRLVEQAKIIIEKALSEADFLISWSTGKDSTALAHLVRSVDGSVPIVIQFDDCDWPEKRPYSERVCAVQRWEIFSVFPDFSIWEEAKKLRIGHENICAQTHDLTRDGFLKPLENIRKSLNCNGTFLGLRNEESDARRMNLCKRGALYQLKDGTWRCSPLWQWKASDVFAYLVSHEVEINPCYFQNKFMPPENIRLSWALPTPGGLCHGDMEHIRYYYPEHFARLRELEVV